MLQIRPSTAKEINNIKNKQTGLKPTLTLTYKALHELLHHLSPHLLPAPLALCQSHLPSMLFLQHVKQVPTSEPLLFPLLVTLIASSLTSLRSLLKSHLLEETFPDFCVPLLFVSHCHRLQSLNALLCYFLLTGCSENSRTAGLGPGHSSAQHEEAQSVFVE